MSYERDYTPIPPPVPAWRARLALYWQLVRGDRPIGWLLLLWPTWWGLWLAAGGVPPLWTLVVFTAGVWLTRSAGCVINDYADRWLDPQVERTRHRPLATGAVRGREALAVFAVLMLVAFALVLTLNRLTIYLSVVGVLLAASYPFLKRYTYLPQLYLGLAFGWGIPMAFAAVQGKVPEVAWLLFLGNLLWTTGYDTWYAMVDRDDDLRAGAKSTAILFGDLDLIAQAIIYGGFLVTMLLLTGRGNLGFVYLASLG
ncbi:MAG TPA: 4-hydroxybenzoate octaprenyltransferase, partial [Lysobacter sp.]|nr:4-hydroxybenzoate octaprenyltransferase [Lysobacter sp.]